MFHSAPEFIAITPEMRERLEKFRTQHANDKIGRSRTTSCSRTRTSGSGR